MKNINKIIIVLATFLFLPCISYYGFLFVNHNYNIHFLQIDACQSEGGKWNHKSQTCDWP
ncbi:hypothetical protein [Fluviispira multicolorata]|uniref:Uncharacterized protein n=1 Tax=Fluviispira multicolorata TaxID=2654512 RepID=A0A833JH31_9BACT|nr:hypothetical protein [Fluviispira multicolorata]KAB8033267.1 hypothetical protein GCL57_00805 [Fluviispira multicolorata]